DLASASLTVCVFRGVIIRSQLARTRANKIEGDKKPVQRNRNRRPPRPRGRDLSARVIVTNVLTRDPAISSILFRRQSFSRFCHGGVGRPLRWSMASSFRNWEVTLARRNFASWFLAGTARF